MTIAALKADIAERTARRVRRMSLANCAAVSGTLIAGRNHAHERRFDEVLFRVHTGVRSEPS
jgi:hypothetical protein